MPLDFNHTYISHTHKSQRFHHRIVCIPVQERLPLALCDALNDIYNLGASNEEYHKLTMTRN